MPSSASTKQRRKWIDAGLCTYCGQEPRPGLRTCQPCADKQNGYTQKHLKKKRSHGQCVCGKRLSTATHCRPCAEKHSERVNVLALKRIEQGLCPRCLEPNERRTYFCKPCMDKRKPYKDEYRKKRAVVLKQIKEGWKVPPIHFGAREAEAAE